MIKKLLKINRKSFRFKIAFYYLVASLSVILISSGVIYTVVSYLIVEETVSKTEMTLQTTSDNVGEILRYKKSLLELYSSDKTLKAFAAGETELEEAVTEQLTALAKSDANILGVYVSLNNGVSLTSAEVPFSEYSDDVITQVPCLTNDRTGSYQHSDDWIVTLALPIYDENGVQLGVIGVDMDYCIFSHTIGKLNLGENDLIFIEDRDGSVVFRSDKIYPSGDNADAVLSGMLEKGFDSKSNTLVYSVLIPNSDWTMYGVVTPTGLEILKRQLFDMVISTTLLLSCALLVISVVVSRNLTDPISRLAAGMEDIQELAELSIREDEISETAMLTQSYNRMIQKIKDLMQELEDKQEELRSAEFDTLASQINPHFLYNTLDTIVWLAEFQDTEKIITLTKSLASFFRLSLNGGRSVVSLEDEIAHVQQYLIIQKERYGDKFDYRFTIDENALGTMMPKILLQPLVENAIYHGIKPMDTNGFIEIKAEMQGTCLVVSIVDNGVGIQASNGFQPVKSSLDGVGLKNVEKRIKLFFGEGSGMKMQSSEKGTTVTLLLCRNENRNENLPKG